MSEDLKLTLGTPCRVGRRTILRDEYSLSLGSQFHKEACEMALCKSDCAVDQSSDWACFDIGGIIR